MGEQLGANGPFRATVLWNCLIRTFRSDIPLGRHRRYMKTYDDCFVASEAVDWLHQYLKNNPNFGTNVNRSQAVQLMQKLHKTRLFEDVRSAKHNHEQFSDSGRLFRLTLVSPSKVTRTPIALRNNLKLANLRRSPTAGQPRHPDIQPVKLDFGKTASMPSIPDNMSTLPDCYFVAKPLSAVEIENEWKSMTLESLQKVLGVVTLNDIIDQQYLDSRYVMHNCLYINKSGVVTNIDPKDQLPHWALSAMKCLAYWPDKTDENLPSYPGFEKDVFRVVRDYFCGLSQPLMTFNMYEVITNVFECQDASEGYASVANILDLSPIQPVHDSSSNRSGRFSGDDQPVTRFETAFGPDNRTVTRVFYGDGVATDFNHIEGAVETEHTPIETHFETDRQESGSSQPGSATQGSGSSTSSFNRKSSLRHSVQNLFNRVPSIRDRRVRREKTFSRRRSVGCNLDDEGSYGCAVGVYSNPSSMAGSYDDTPVSRLSHPNVTHRSRSREQVPPRHSQDRNRTQPCQPSYQSKPPMHGNPPKYSTLYPESQYPKSHQTNHPVIDGAKRLFKKRRSASSATLQQQVSNSLSESSDSGCRNSSSVSDGNPSNAATGDKEVIGARSLSMSDLAGVGPPVENELQRQCQGRIQDSDDSVVMDEKNTERIIKALQLVCLLLPPANRRRLHLLLRLMNKMSTNDKLVLDEKISTRTLLLETFYRAVLTCQDDVDLDDLLVIQLVAFLMDHYVEVFTVPADLKTNVEARIAKLQRTKIGYDDVVYLHYCKQVSLDEYENQRLTGSQQALATLLEEIIQNKTMAIKEKKKRLNQFKKMHPDVYLHRFPCSQSETELFPPRPKIKQPLLVRPLLKLKGLRF